MCVVLLAVTPALAKRGAHRSTGARNQCWHPGERIAGCTGHRIEKAFTPEIIAGPISTVGPRIFRRATSTWPSRLQRTDSREPTRAAPIPPRRSLRRKGDPTRAIADLASRHQTRSKRFLRLVRPASPIANRRPVAPSPITIRRSGSNRAIPGLQQTAAIPGQTSTTSIARCRLRPGDQLDPKIRPSPGSPGHGLSKNRGDDDRRFGRSGYLDPARCEICRGLHGKRRLFRDKGDHRPRAHRFRQSLRLIPMAIATPMPGWKCLLSTGMSMRKRYPTMTGHPRPIPTTLNALNTRATKGVLGRPRRGLRTARRRLRAEA